MRIETKTSRPVPAKERLVLGGVDSTHVWVLGIVVAKPNFPYPLERAHSLSDKTLFSTISPYQESPIWDWAGDLLAQA